jgi:hypothetical protein
MTHCCACYQHTVAYIGWCLGIYLVLVLAGRLVRAAEAYKTGIEDEDRMRREDRM